MYLHLLDHNRGKALANKGGSVLIGAEGVPAEWWDPVPHNGLIFDKSAGKWIGPLSDQGNAVNNENATPTQKWKRAWRERIGATCRLFW